MRDFPSPSGEHVPNHAPPRRPVDVFDPAVAERVRQRIAEGEQERALDPDQPMVSLDDVMRGQFEAWGNGRIGSRGTEAADNS
jgi:hypothetical protein